MDDKHLVQPRRASFVIQANTSSLLTNGIFFFLFIISLFSFRFFPYHVYRYIFHSRFSLFFFLFIFSKYRERNSTSLALPLSPSLIFHSLLFLLLTLPRRNPRLTQSKEKRLSSCRPSSAPSSSPSSATSPTSSCAPPCSEITTTRGTWGYSEWFPEGLASSLPGRSYKKRKKRGRA